MILKINPAAPIGCEATLLNDAGQPIGGLAGISTAAALAFVVANQITLDPASDVFPAPQVPVTPPPPVPADGSGDAPDDSGDAGDAPAPADAPAAPPAPAPVPPVLYSLLDAAGNPIGNMQNVPLSELAGFVLAAVAAQ